MWYQKILRSLIIRVNKKIGFTLLCINNVFNINILSA
jgi:hypothetical protein